LKRIICFQILFVLIVSIFSSTTLTVKAEQQTTTRFPWTTYKHDLHRSGYTDSPAPQQPTLLWKSEIPEYYYISAPSVANGKVFTGRYALDQTNGYLLWDAAVYDPRLVNVGSSPTVDGGEVYLTTFDGYIYCLCGENGAIIWSYKVGEGEQIYSSPAVTQDKVFVTTTFPGSETGYLYALWKQGTFLWKIEIGESYSSPAISDGVIFVTSYQDVYAISEEGMVIWHSSIYPDIFAEGTATISGDNIILYSITKVIYCFDKSTGELKWQKMIPRPTQIFGYGGGVAVAYGNVYVATFDGEIFALDELTGNDKWDVKVGDSIFTSPSIADGKVFVSSIEYVDGDYGKGKILALDASSGRILWFYEHPDPEVYVPPFFGGWSSPVIADSCIFVGFIGQKIDRPFTREVLCIGGFVALPNVIASWQMIDEPDNLITPGDRVKFQITLRNIGDVDANELILSLSSPSSDVWIAKFEEGKMGGAHPESYTLNLDIYLGSLSTHTSITTYIEVWVKTYSSQDYPWSLYPYYIHGYSWIDDIPVLGEHNIDISIKSESNIIYTSKLEIDVKYPNFSSFYTSEQLYQLKSFLEGSETSPDYPKVNTFHPTNELVKNVMAKAIAFNLIPYGAFYRLNGAADTPYSAIRCIHNWMCAYYLAGGNVPRWSDIEIIQRLMEYKGGDCNQFADLTISLCRSANIPARELLGLTMRRVVGDIWVFWPDVAHVWTEAYVDNRWVQVDPALDLFDNPSGVYYEKSIMFWRPKIPWIGGPWYCKYSDCIVFEEASLLNILVVHRNHLADAEDNPNNYIP